MFADARTATLVSLFCSINMLTSLALPSSARPTQEERYMSQNWFCSGKRSTSYENRQNRDRCTTSAEPSTLPWIISSYFPSMTFTSSRWRCVHRVCNKLDDGVNHPLYKNYAHIFVTTMAENKERLRTPYILEEPPKILSIVSMSVRTSPQQ